MVFKKYVKFFLIALSLHFVVGCASSGSKDFLSTNVQKDYSDMYLRGVFNWWEANENFRLQPINNSEYAVTIELIADNQPYDFKVADANWNMQLDCGNTFDAAPMMLDRAVELVCASDSLNLQFTPTETGLYQFTLDVSDNDEPELTIRRIDD